jgi:hypothetical protein
MSISDLERILNGNVSSREMLAITAPRLPRITRHDAMCVNQGCGHFGIQPNAVELKKPQAELMAGLLDRQDEAGVFFERELARVRRELARVRREKDSDAS